jgi:hypothetical protein
MQAGRPAMPQVDPSQAKPALPCVLQEQNPVPGLVHTLLFGQTLGPHGTTKLPAPQYGGPHRPFWHACPSGQGLPGPHWLQQ